MIEERHSMCNMITGKQMHIVNRNELLRSIVKMILEN